MPPANYRDVQDSDGLESDVAFSESNGIVPVFPKFHRRPRVVLEETPIKLLRIVDAR